MEMESFGFKFMTNLSLNLLVITWKFSDLLVTLPAISKCCRIGVLSRMLWRLRILISHICDMSKFPSCIFLLQFLIFLVMISVYYLLLLENLLSILPLSWMFSCTLSWSFLFPVLVSWSGLLQLVPFLLFSNHSTFHMLKYLTQFRVGRMLLQVWWIQVLLGNWGKNTFQEWRRLCMPYKTYGLWKFVTQTHLLMAGIWSKKCLIDNCFMAYVFVHSWSQAHTKVEGCGRLMANVKFIYFSRMYPIVEKSWD